MNEGIEGWTDRPTDRNERVLRRRAQRARGEKPSGTVTRGDERVMLDPNIDVPKKLEGRDRRIVSTVQPAKQQRLSELARQSGSQARKGFTGANTMMNQLLGLRKDGETTMKMVKPSMV